MSLHIFDTVDEALHSLAVYFIDAANRSIEEHGVFTVALSGGSSPQKFYSLLASATYKDKLNWEKVFFFFGDERYVPATSPDSNYRMAKEVLFEPLNIDASKIFPVDTSLPQGDAASKYMVDINKHFKGKQPRFDLVLLGLGDNSHTASLFPHTDILNEQDATIKAVYLNDQKVYRISFTAPLINLANRVAFLVYGEAKSGAVYNILKGEHDPQNFPAQLIKPTDGEVEWFVDKEASSKL